MRRTRRPVLVAVAALVVALLPAACSESLAPLVGVRDVIYAPSLGVDVGELTLAANGLGYQDQQVGTGAVAESGTTASVRYVGYLSNGARFDGNEAAGAALLPVAIGTATSGVRTVPGFEQGITSMRVGGMRKIVIPPALAYGRAGLRDNSGRVVVPGNSVIVFDVELVEVR